MHAARLPFGSSSLAAAIEPSTAASPLECRELSQQYAAAKQSLVDRQVNVYLSQAAQKGCAELATELLKDGASVHARRREGDTALHHAVKATQPDVARILLEQGADIELRNLSGATPLYLAIEANRPKTVALLLERGANVNAPGRSAVAPIAAAAFNGNEAIVGLLLAKGADPDAGTTRANPRSSMPPRAASPESSKGCSGRRLTSTRAMAIS